MSDEKKHDSFEHEEELKKRNPDERSPDQRGDDATDDLSESAEGLLGGVPGARGNKPTG